jgi:hypothetical protein
VAFELPIAQAQRWDVVIQQGSTFERTLDFIDLDLDGMFFRGQIRRSHEDPEVLADYEFTITLPNTLTVRLEAEQTELLPPGRLVHDIEAFIPGYVARVLEGKVKVTPEVTR